MSVNEYPKMTTQDGYQSDYACFEHQDHDSLLMKSNEVGSKARP